MRILLVAALLTLLNMLKPAVIDDTAYLLFARHLAQNPLDPYGFELFWYAQPDPAMHILLPPVLPYWLALGIRIFGEDLVLLKLWLFPFAWLLTWSTSELLNRFAPRQRAAMPFMVFSGFIVPLFSVMLDVPALALGLAALVWFLRSLDTGQLSSALLSAILLSLALQTKYSMLTMPLVFVGATVVFGGLQFRPYRCLFIVGLLVAAMFFGWESFLARKYGQSHFFLHVQSQDSGDWLRRKLNLVTPLLKFLGLLTAGWGLYAARAIGFPRWLVASVMLFGVVGTVAVMLTPGREAVLLRSADGTPRYDLPMLVFGTLGISLAMGLAVGVGRLMIRLPSGRIRPGRASWFLVGWLLVEALGYFVLTPFPAGRRIMGLSVVIALVCCRLVSLALPRCDPGALVKAYILVMGLGLFALETWDALPERELAHQAAAVAQPAPGGTVWTQGHWGWQYYTDRAGMKLVQPGVTRLVPGDVLVLPIEPDAVGFYRPYHGFANLKLEDDRVELLQELVWEDWLPAQTIPNLHGGFSPIIGRDHPRLRVRIYRVLDGWLAQRPR